MMSPLRKTLSITNCCSPQRVGDEFFAHFHDEKGFSEWTQWLRIIANLHFLPRLFVICAILSYDFLANLPFFTTTFYHNKPDYRLNLKRSSPLRLYFHNHFLILR